MMRVFSEPIEEFLFTFAIFVSLIFHLKSKAGIIEEMLEDTMETLDPDDIEEEADEEVEKVLFELTAGQLIDAPSAVSESLPAEPEGATAAVSDEEDVSEMQARLEALRS